MQLLAASYLHYGRAGGKEDQAQSQLLTPPPSRNAGRRRRTEAGAATAAKTAPPPPPGFLGGSLQSSRVLARLSKPSPLPASNQISSKSFRGLRSGDAESGLGVGVCNARKMPREAAGLREGCKAAGTDLARGGADSYTP